MGAWQDAVEVPAGLAEAQVRWNGDVGRKVLLAALAQTCVERGKRAP